MDLCLTKKQRTVARLSRHEKTAVKSEGRFRRCWRWGLSRRKLFYDYSFIFINVKAAPFLRQLPKSARDALNPVSVSPLHNDAARSTHPCRPGARGPRCVFAVEIISVLRGALRTSLPPSHPSSYPSRSPSCLVLFGPWFIPFLERRQDNGTNDGQLGRPDELSFQSPPRCHAPLAGPMIIHVQLRARGNAGSTS